MRITLTLAGIFLMACGPTAALPDGGAGNPGATPTTRDGLLALAQSGAYLGWKAEPAAHPSAGPHGNTVRTFVNTALYDSLEAGNAAHPNGSIAVKELFTAGTRSGWAIDAKGDDGVWTYFEGFEPALNQYFFRGNGNLCSQCHQAGVDQVLVVAADFR